MGSCAWLVLSVLLVTGPAVAQKRPLKSGRSKLAVSVECSLSAEQLDKLTGMPGELVLANGKRIVNITIVKFVHGQTKDTVRQVIYRRPKSKTISRKRGSLLARIIVSGKAYDLVLVAALKSRVLVDVAKKEKVVSARLKAVRRRLWAKLSEEQQAAAVQEQKEFLTKVRKSFSSLPLKLYETKFFLFCTDMPSAHIGGYISHLDQMNIDLGKQFGVPAGDNIWRGKAVFLVFVNRNSFTQFEMKFMNDPAAARQAQGLCHQRGNGDVIVACFRGDDPHVFAQMLVHETTHGYLHRFKSSARVPSWLHEGIAEWVSANVVRSSRVTQRRQQEAVIRLKQTGVIGRSFFGKRIETWHYGVASRITDSLIKKDPQAFRSWIVAIKEGIGWEEGLQKTFGITPLQLMQAYGRIIGVPMIRLQ